jgi:glycosyltransferase involved in cell wall biosynthesis
LSRPTSPPPAPPESRGRVRESLAVTDSAFLLLLPSRVDPRKGQENILRAIVEARHALAQRPFRLLLLAWPEHPTDYAIRLRQFIAEHGLGDCVLTHPPVPHHRMPSYFAAADRVALPSQECFSIVMLEAMLLECPLIASVHGGLQDVITEGLNGFLVDHNDVPQLARAIVRLVGMDRAALRDMGRRARHTILESYTWGRVARRLLAIYYDAVARS